MNGNVMIIGEGRRYSLNCKETKLNNNVLVVGGSGTGKTTSIVLPNLRQATGSYVVTDPKGNLYRKMGPYLKERGYKVLKLDLSNPNDEVRYNFFDYINKEQDVLKVARMIADAGGKNQDNGKDPYWYNTSELVGRE